MLKKLRVQLKAYIIEADKRFKRVHLVWKDEEALEYHIQSAHYQEYRNNITDLMSNREVYKLKIME